MRTGNFLFLILLCTSAVFAQSGEPLEIRGKTFSGQIINGENVREFEGDVFIVQGAVRINCDRAIQYLNKNEAELIGKVVVVQDSIIIRTERGYYYGNTKIAYSKVGVSLTDGHVQLNSKNGFYYFDEKRSFFYDNVTLQDNISDMKADRLTYYDDNDKAVAAGNVQVSDTASTIFADSLIHFRQTKITNAFNNVRIYNPTNRLAIFGNVLEDDGIKNYSKVTGKPFLIRIDTTNTGALDTLLISAQQMESFDDSTKKMIVKDSVKIIRHNFVSVNELTIFHQKNDYLQTYRRESDQSSPVIWNENTQLVGDTINITLKDNRLAKIEMRYESSIITPNKDSVYRFDQLSGRNINMFFDDGDLSRTEVDGNVLSIYYMYEEDTPNGLLKSSSERAKIFFDNRKVIDVHFYGKPVSEYHPENEITGKEKDFTIPTFRIFSNKPKKENLLLSRKDVLAYLIKDSKYYAEKLNPKK